VEQGEEPCPSSDTPTGYAESVDELSYSVPNVSCDHCRAAITDEVGSVGGVREVLVDLEGKRVVVRGERLDDAALRAAIEEAGYEAA
jgi:copper chaperone